MKEAALNNQALYFDYTRMSPTIFEELYGLVAPHLARQNTLLRTAVSVGIGIWLYLFDL